MNFWSNALTASVHCSLYFTALTMNLGRARATALEKGVDALLDPLLDSVEKAIPQSQHLTWTTMELEDLYALLKSAAQTNVALTKCSSAVARLLGLMLAIHVTAQANKVNELHVASMWTCLGTPVDLPSVLEYGAVACSSPEATAPPHSRGAHCAAH